MCVGQVTIIMIILLLIYFLYVDIFFIQIFVVSLAEPRLPLQIDDASRPETDEVCCWLGHCIIF